ncbi:MAG: methylmalonyl Co-A mutase-associated GTPase MeaB [Gemmatimonadetes bacterium]|nr:MAG: methylmalonyl Co-A mutase-associated GTPase MeaB [Gemmatimonadota bacterium]
MPERSTLNVVRGLKSRHDGIAGGHLPGATTPPLRRKPLTVEDYVQGVLAADRTILARTITLIESNSDQHMQTAQDVLKSLLPHTGNSIRVGITGVPGVGKSTFIEGLGTYLCERGHRVAVLAVDPSSRRTKGSILGDKTRMEHLSRHENAFIRPSPSGGTLGGVTRKSRETMLVCEAAGFDVILVETVGVGQSEITVRSMVDFFLLLMLTGAGDELQGIKKGVIETADALVINKADGENQLPAQRAKVEYNRALHYLSPATEGWQTQAYTCSSLTGEGLPEIWQVIQQFVKVTQASGVFQQRRKEQLIAWVYAMVEDHLKHRFFHHPAVKAALPNIQQSVAEGRLPATTAASMLLTLFDPDSSSQTKPVQAD